MYSTFQNNNLPYPYRYCGFCHDFHFIGYFLNFETHTLKQNCVQNTSTNTPLPFSIYPVSPISLPTMDMQKHPHFSRYLLFTAVFCRFKRPSALSQLKENGILFEQGDRCMHCRAKIPSDPKTPSSSAIIL